GRTGNTTASPWPTSQATTNAPAGGHPGASHRTGAAPRNSPSATTARISRGHGHRASRNTAAVRAARATPPATPAGHGTAASGTLAPAWAIQTNQRAGQEANHATNAAASGHNGERPA